jgi:cell division protein FtsL
MTMAGGLCSFGAHAGHVFLVVVVVAVAVVAISVVTVVEETFTKWGSS